MTANLPRYERPACACCGTMAPECWVPTDNATGASGGDGAAPCCWLCAHLITEHDAKIGDGISQLRALEGCRCPGSEIYPRDVLRTREAMGVRSPRDVDAPDLGDVLYRVTEGKPITETQRALWKHSLAVARGMREARRARLRAAFDPRTD